MKIHPKISVLLPVYNSASTVRHTLESVKWADEIVIVDSYSSDQTLEICRDYTAKIIQHEYVSPAKQKNWAVKQCLNDWVFQIDSDEVMEEGLKEEMENALASASGEIHAFRIPRKNYSLGRWLRFGGIYPDYQIRLFRKDKGDWFEREVHEYVRVKGETGTLKFHLLHTGMPNISKQLKNLDRYTRYEADEMLKRDRRFRWYHLIFYPFFIFLYRYFWLQGFRDGWRGFIICQYLAIYEFLAKAKLWEIQELKLKQSPQ